MRTVTLLLLAALASGCAAGSRSALPRRFSSGLLVEPAAPRRWPEPRAAKKRRRPQRKLAAIARRARAQIGRIFVRDGDHPAATRAFLSAAFGRPISSRQVRALERRASSDRPRSGYLVFFRRLHGRADIGVVLAVRGPRISFAYLCGSRARRGLLDLARPDLRRRGGRILNSYVRIKRPEDPAGAHYLAGQLLLGFARALRP